MDQTMATLFIPPLHIGVCRWLIAASLVGIPSVRDRSKPNPCCRCLDFHSGERRLHCVWGPTDCGALRGDIEQGAAYQRDLRAAGHHHIRHGVLEFVS